LAEYQGRTKPAGIADEGTAAEKIGPPESFIAPKPAAVAPTPPTPTPAETAAQAPAAAPTEPSAPPQTPPAPARIDPMAAAKPPPPRPLPGRWQDVTDADVANITFEALPPDSGVVAPWAAADQFAEASAQTQLQQVRAGLGAWAPAKVDDPVQRARNILYIAAVPDLLQMADVEPFLPRIVQGRLLQAISPTDLPKVLYWIGTHPQDGTDDAMDDLSSLGLPKLNGPTRREARIRAMVYAFKMLARTTGRDTPQ
jgi:hypothetical protein